MARPLDVGALLRRGGIMTADEVKQLAQDLTQAKLVEMSIGSSERSLDQPVKVIPFSNDPPASVGGYFTQQKFIWGKMPEECKQYLEFLASSEKALVFSNSPWLSVHGTLRLEHTHTFPMAKSTSRTRKRKCPHSDVKRSSSSQQTAIQSNILRGKHLIH